MTVDLSNYAEVAEREVVFYERYPDGSIQCSIPVVIEVGGKTFIEVTATAFRTPADPTPGRGTAWEPFPGRTGYTRDAEMMNAETSAVGRALRWLGISVKRGASAEEVRARVPERTSSPSPNRLVPIRAALAKAKVTRAADQLEVANIVAGHDVQNWHQLNDGDLDALERVAADLIAGRALIEEDERGGKRIVAVEAAEPETDGEGHAP